MKNLKWICLAAGVLAVGSLAVSMAPDIYRYLRIRSM
jgi:hypothetical protein